MHSLPVIARDSERGALLTVHVQPGSSRTECVGIHGNAVKIRLATRPIDGAANDELIRHHAPDGAAFDAMFDHLHPVHLHEGGMIARALGKSDATVNSVHYQGIGTLAPGLHVEATAPDGLVEAYSARPNGAPLVAVQWHPEWDADTNPDSAAYFHLLGKALRGEA